MASKLILRLQSTQLLREPLQAAKQTEAQESQDQQEQQEQEKTQKRPGKNKKQKAPKQQDVIPDIETHRTDNGDDHEQQDAHLQANLEGLSLGKQQDSDSDDSWGAKRGGGKGSKRGKKSTSSKSTAGSKAAAPASLDPTEANAVQSDLTKDTAKSASGSDNVKTRAKAKPELFVCNVCATVLPTRNKLFEHIRETGHALASQSSSQSRTGSGSGSGSSRKKK
eukprot:jgi/Hompol1/4454/HPOL_000216-RA